MEWTLNAYFSGIDTEAYSQFKTKLINDIDALQKELTDLLNGEHSSNHDVAAAIVDYESIKARTAHLGSYVGCLVSSNANNEAYQNEESWLGDLEATIAKNMQVLLSLFKHLSDEALEVLIRHPALDGLENLLREWKENSALRMDDELEFLAADLDNCGSAAFSRLYFKFTGNLEFKYKDNAGDFKTVPFSQYRSLLSAESPSLRRAVFEGAEKTLVANKEIFGSALNSIAGARLQLNKRRGVSHHLDNALKQSRISRSTFEALHQAIENNLPFSRSILKNRLKAMGLKSGSYADLYAPIPMKDAEGLSWNETVPVVEKSFRRAYPALADYFKRIIDERWVDYSPRESKRAGGYCTHSFITKETRIFMTFNDNMNDVMTLAHEAGHAWHAELLNDQRYFLGDYPMTVAESASTFAEMILSDGILRSDDFSPAQKKMIIDADTARIVAFLLEVPVRCAFENRFYEERLKGEVPVSRIRQLMIEEQQRYFGDALGDGGEDAYFWASKLHFYIHETQFYNFPYYFGYLLSVSMMNRFREEGDSFLDKYENYLKITADGSVESIMKRAFGEDISTVEFWDRAIQSLHPQLDQLKAYFSS